MLRRNVLIFHLGALGDFVLTWPLAMALGRLFAQSRILYVTHGEKGALAQRALRVESISIEGGWHELFSAEPQLTPFTRKVLDASHSVFSFITRSEDNWMRNLRALAPEAELVRLEPRPPQDYRGHFTDFLVEQLGPWPAVQASTIAMLRTICQRGVAASQQRSHRIVIHPGSGGAHKCWPAERFLALIERLRNEGRDVRVILGEAELERWPAETIARFQKLSDVRHPQNLLELFEEVSTASVVVMNDSGPAHLAGMLGTPALVLFGPSNPTIWRPLGPRVAILQQQPIADISVQQAHEKLTSLLSPTE